MAPIHNRPAPGAHAAREAAAARAPTRYRAAPVSPAAARRAHEPPRTPLPSSQEEGSAAGRGWCGLQRSIRHALALLLLALICASAPARAEVRLPDGEYYTAVEDLSVKIMGGYVSASRSWFRNRWYFNAAWAPLSFTYDSLDGSVKAIERAGWRYERSDPASSSSTPATSSAPLPLATAGRTAPATSSTTTPTGASRPTVTATR